MASISPKNPAHVGCDGASENDHAGVRIVSEYKAQFQDLQAPPPISGYVIDARLLVIMVARHG